ncbi:hypothetical protein RDABS01_034812 [Bienertia sinuspersici]
MRRILEWIDTYA